MSHRAALEEALDYSFADPGLLEEALTHPSCGAGYDYERLEFLGDAVIELFVSSFLFTNYPDVPEGTLTRKRAIIVCTEGLALIAGRLELSRYLILGHGEEVNSGRTKASILENTMEAIAGAVYVDGGYQAAWQVLDRLFAGRCAEVMRSPLPAADSKSRLQEKIQGGIKQEISYEVTASEGPPHSPTFYVELVVGGRSICAGRGSSKKAAEQMAAAEALEHFDEYFPEENTQA
ncbi:MAG: ribonuclease III [Clostridia bacterium]|nr:ribonuclease III [Clostridia bacterium]